jgi:hypothetical protein
MHLKKCMAKKDIYKKYIKIYKKGHKNLGDLWLWVLRLHFCIWRVMKSWKSERISKEMLLFLRVAMDKFLYKLMLKMRTWWWWNGSECCTAKCHFLFKGSWKPSNTTYSVVECRLPHGIRGAANFYYTNAIQLSNQFFIL